MRAAFEAHGAATLDKFKEANLPQSGAGQTSSMGEYDPITKEWK